MSEASTPPIKIQAYTACPLSIDAQNVQELKFENLSPMPTRQYEPFMLDGGSVKSEGKSTLLCERQQDTIFGGHEMGLQSALKSSACKPMKTIRPAVEKLHCCITEVGLIQCFANSPLT